MLTQISQDAAKQGMAVHKLYGCTQTLVTASHNGGAPVIGIMVDANPGKVNTTDVNWMQQIGAN